MIESAYELIGTNDIDPKNLPTSENTETRNLLM